ncbi:hypothetical protein [Burkholderia sp. NLJ2]|uniref:hypothetical protein n=1 Tax=Burkholderia sp. NLJ2 TaxID=3090699 RepID=UPI003C6C037D
MPTMHPPSDSPSFGLLPAAEPGRHRHRINPKISFQIQLAIQIERIAFEFQFILFQGFDPAGAARCRTGNPRARTVRQLSAELAHLVFRIAIAVRYAVMSMAPFTWVQKIARKKFCRQTLFDARIQSLEDLFK